MALEILGALVEPVINYIIKPTIHQLSYLFCYKRNIKDLEKKLEVLEHTRDKVQSLVDEKRSNSYEIYSEVSEWLKEVDSELLETPPPNEGSSLSWFNCVQGHQVARKAKKRVDSILKLIEDGEKFDKDNVGHPVPLPNTRSISLPEDYQIIKSRTLLAEKIKDALVEPNVNKVGACGMGGVGKTKLLNEVKKLVLENKLFDGVIYVEVGQSKSVFKIQEEIVGELNMKVNQQCETVRAHRLQTKLVEMKDNMLIMLDDLWHEYDLENEIGIPCRSESRKGCKILMTGRSRDLFTNKMNIECLFEVNILSDEESWKFFTATVNESFDEAGHMRQIAKDVVKECGGLPIALKILGKALKGKRVEIWKDALNTLKNSVVVNIPGVSKELYSCLQFSYDSIEDEAKLVLLLCSVFPDDHDIDMKDLQIYAMGMGLLNHINTWEGARNRVIKLVDHLKSSYLLLTSDEKEDCVKMHDVVHDFAKWITSKMDKMSSLTYGSGQREWKEEDRHGSYNAIYVNCSEFLNLPSKLEFPNLQLFILTCNRRTGRTQISETFFEGMEELRILDMTCMSFAPSSWTSLIRLLKNLQALCLSECECNDIDIIGELKKLEILRIISCQIQELPMSMNELTQLKVLQVSNCYELKVIHPNIISKMTRLEELNLMGSFIKWGEDVWYKNKLIKNAKLSELNSLTLLVHLELIIIRGIEILSNELSLERAQKLERFYIHALDEEDRLGVFIFRADSMVTNTLILDIKSPIESIGGVLQILLYKCEKLRVKDSVDFTKLLCNPNGNSFCTLQKITFVGCNKVKNLLPSCFVRSLVFLKELRVRKCMLVESIFETEESTDDVNRVVPLETLELDYLPKLKHVWNNDPNSKLLTFPNLKRVWVRNCPQLKTLFPASFINHMKEIQELEFHGNEIFGEVDEASQLVSPQIALFPNFEKFDHTVQSGEKKKLMGWIRVVS